MEGRSKRNFWKKTMSFVLAFGLGISGIGISPVGNTETKAAEPISIGSAEDLQKIGNDAAYPLDGDYRLTQDIDMSQVNFTPIGGGMGKRGSDSGANVFSGTFDGDGHIISNLTIQKKENSSEEWQYGLFGIIGSSDAGNKASVRNLILSQINIDVDMTAENNAAYLSLGGLAGEVNRNAEIDNIAIIGGMIQGNNSNQGDVVGAGGLIGEMRPDLTSGSNGVTISNIYVGCDIVCGSSTSQNYAGGIIGRAAKASPDSVTACVFTGNVSYKGDGGYGISGGEITDNFSYCYYRFGLSNTGKQMSTAQLQASELLEGLDSSKWTASAGSYMMLTQCVNSEEMRETLILDGLSLTLAAGDTFSSVTQNFTVPMSIQFGTATETLTWKSDNEEVMQINANDGTVQVVPKMKEEKVTLTASTKSGKTKSFQLTVKANITLSFDQEYAKVGEAVTASLTGAPQGIVCTYDWSVDGVSKGSDVSYTPAAGDLEKMLSVTVELADSEGNELGECGPIRMFISKLPVVYINTDDGSSIDSKTDYEGAQMRIQGNDRYSSTEVALYDGAIEIRGRGNSTWNQAVSSGGKRPYKLKLDKKTDLLGFGESKHWALLANYMDESLLRNKTSYDLAGEMGIQPFLPSANVELILNGQYAGNYQLVGNVRVQESRVNIYNWEDLAEDAAKAIAKAEKANGQTVDQDALEDYMNQNMHWITSGRVSFNGKTYTISDYAVEIPKNSSGGIDVSGGFLFELDGYYDEVSKFRTDTYQPIMFKSPEFIRPTTGAGEGVIEKPDNSKQKCDALYNYAYQYIQAVEDTVHSPDYYTTIEETESKENVSNFTTDFKGRQHYTDLVDMDSLVKYLLLNEFYWNTETMKKSTFMYKDLGEKLMIGPVWDMDWTSNSLISQDETRDYNTWMVVTRQAGSALREQKESWYRYLIGDPYFVEKLYECYWDYREKFEDIAKSGGIIDQERAYLAESGESNYNLKGGLHARCLMGEPSFDAGVTRLQTYLQNRLRWMDQQFGWSDGKTPDAASSKTTLDGLLTSFQKYQDTSDGKISVSVDTAVSAAETAYTANVTDDSIKKVGFYINGRLAGTQTVENGKAVLKINDGTAGLEKNIEKKAYVNNVVQAMAMDEAGNLMTVKGRYNDKEIDVSISDYTLFQKEIAADALTGTVEIQGLARVGCTLQAVVSNTNNSGKLSYQWKADNVPIERATQESYVLTDAEEGKVITVEVASSWETGSIVSEATSAVVKVVVLNDHIIINQVYGGGANTDSAVSHSFIELYNPTDQEISLAGYTLYYYSQGKNGATGNEGAVLNLDEKTIPAKHSYLIRCEAQTIVAPEYSFYLTIEDDKYDQAWTQTIDNKRYKILLYDKNNQLADGVSVNEGNIAEEGEQIPDNMISKQKSIRRKNFADTNNNKADFDVIDYRVESIEINRPRCLADGAWEAKEPDPEPTELKGKVSIRGNAIAGAILYADVTEDADSYIGEVICKWKADDKEIENTAGRFLPTDASYAGKKISVEVVSADEGVEGMLQASMTSEMKVVEAQRDHLIINQVYGDGEKKDVPLSHSFIELYNPTDQEVDVSGYSVQYESDGASDELSLSGVIPSRHAYLIRCKPSKSADAAPVQIAEGDAAWESLTINNKQYRILLKNGEEQIDGVSVNENEAEGTPLTDPDPVNDDTIISKKKAVRRINFVDTDENASDFETLNYTNLHEWELEELIAAVRPRSIADGAWGLKESEDNKQPSEEILQKAEQAKQEAEKIANDKSQYTEESYRKLQTAYEALLKALESKDAGQIVQATADVNEAIRKLEKASNQEDHKSLVGTQFISNKGWYQITKDSGTERTVTYLYPTKKTFKTAKVMPTVSYNGTSYKVTAIAKKAFAKNKKLRSVTIGKYVETIGASAFAGDGQLRKITVQTSVLKSVGKKALKGIHKNCKIKVPGKSLKDYQKKFKKKGQKSSVRIVK